MTALSVALGLLLLVAFFDPRRPTRLLHLDLAVLVVFAAGPLSLYLGHGQPSGSLPLTVAGLSYLAGRLLYVGLRRPTPRGPLVPLVPVAWLAVAVVLLAGGRAAWNLADREPVRDPGIAAVMGADRIADGRPLYDDKLAYAIDSYGPATYLAYVPFEQLFPWRHGDRIPSRGVDPPAARVAATVFDLLTLLGLFLLGPRLRPGPAGRALGVALAFAWASYPYSLFVLRSGFTDALVALLVVATLLALTGPAARGALSALAAAAKFAPAVLAPLMARGTGGEGRRSALVFALAFVAVSLTVFLPFVPDGGLDELYDRTLGFQQDRRGWNSIWARFPDPGWLQTVAQGAVAGLAILLAFIPRRRSAVQVAALGAGAIAALELTMTFWSPQYAVWFAPLAFAALFAAHQADPAEA